MSDIKLILLNGGKGCGKSVLTQHLIPRLCANEARCKDKLFELTMSLFDVKAGDFWSIYNDRERKEKSNDLFTVKRPQAIMLYNMIGGEDLCKRCALSKYDVPLSVREAMIYVSELVVKPTFGSDYFGVSRAKNLLSGVYIDDSAAFVDEIKPAIDKIGMNNILLVRIYGRGDFEGDSRDYLPDNVVTNVVDVYNNKSESEFLIETTDKIEAFLRGE